MIFVDTGYLVAVANPLDSLHQRATLWSAVTHDSMLVTEYVLVETVNHLSSPLYRLRVHALLQNVQSSPDWKIIPASTQLFQAGVQLHARRSDKEWSLTDCISFSVMETHGVSRALAHDHHFEQAGFESLLRNEP